MVCTTIMRSSAVSLRIPLGGMLHRVGSSSRPALTAIPRRRYQSTSPPRRVVVVPPPPPTPHLRYLGLRSAGQASQNSPSPSTDPLDSGSPPGEPPSERRVRRPGLLLGCVAFLGCFGVALLYRPRPKDFLDPHIYSDQTITSSKKLDEDHVLITLKVEDRSVSKFGLYATKKDGSTPKADEALVQHLYVGQPDIQVERPYTPVNNVALDRTMQFVVKNVKGGELGRMISNKQPDEKLKMRGPLPTFALDMAKYDKVVMISTGTAVSPFIQMLSRMPEMTEKDELLPEPSMMTTFFDRSTSGDPTSSYISPRARVPPKMLLLHALPKAGKTDWLEDSGLLAPLRAKFGDKLDIQRYPQEGIPNTILKPALSKTKGEKIMVLVCLPPKLMAPLCGPMTPLMGQGDVGGMLKYYGLTSDEVLKLE